MRIARRVAMVAAAIGLSTLSACGPDPYSFQLSQCLETMPWISDSEARSCASTRSRECIWASDHDKSRLPYECH